METAYTTPKEGTMSNTMFDSEGTSKALAKQVAGLMSANLGHFSFRVEKVEYQDLELGGHGGRAPARVLVTMADGSTYELLATRWN